MRRHILGLFLLSHLVVCEFEQYGEPVEPGDEDEEEFYNRTYSETQSKLQQDIFRNYNRNERPVRDADTTVEVDLHLHVTHISFNQKEQTMTVNGHMYMSWFDEKLYWNPKDYEGVTQTNVKKWQIWMPDIRVANSISGIYSSHDISKTSHITLQSVSSSNSKDNKVKVETYPTFAIKVGCIMDFSNYPYDEHSCSVGIYSTKKMRQVSLNVYRRMPPTMFLSWSNETQKLSSGEFTIYKASNNISFYRFGAKDDSAPITGDSVVKTWSIYNMYVFYKRHSGHYAVSVMIPLASTMSLSLTSLLLRDVELAVLLNIVTFGLHTLFVRDFVNIIPVSVFKIPRSLIFHGLSTALTSIIFIFHIFIITIGRKPRVQNFMIHGYSCLYNLFPFEPYFSFLGEISKSLGDIRTRGWKLNTLVWRAQLCSILSLVYLVLFTKAFLI